MRLASALRLQRLVFATGSVRPFTEVFRGFEKVEAVKKIFGNRTDKVLNELKVDLTWIEGYMWVNGGNGHLVVSSRYLNEGDRTDIYLDVIHELVHVRQRMEGKELFDHHYNYVERPTEIEAYQHAVTEAQRLGLNRQRILEYLKTEWMTPQDLQKLAKTLNIENQPKTRSTA